MLRMKVLSLVSSIALLLTAGIVGAQEPSRENQRVLGKLAQALRGEPIYFTDNVKSRVYYRVKPYEYLVVDDHKYDAWVKVLMANGKYGYMKSEAVAKLPYEVTTQATSSASSRGSTALMSRGGTTGQVAAGYSTRFIGTPYQWGGNDPNRGIDCSAFVKFVYGQIGVDLPRTAAEQALVGSPVTRYEDLQTGDRLYFWDHKRDKVGHTGIYLGNGYFCHSSAGAGQVTTDYLFSEKWLKILVAARR